MWRSLSSLSLTSIPLSSTNRRCPFPSLNTIPQTMPLNPCLATSYWLRTHGDGDSRNSISRRKPPILRFEASNSGDGDEATMGGLRTAREWWIKRHSFASCRGRNRATPRYEMASPRRGARRDFALADAVFTICKPCSVCTDVAPPNLLRSDRDKPGAADMPGRGPWEMLATEARSANVLSKACNILSLRPRLAGVSPCGCERSAFGENLCRCAEEWGP